MAYGQDQDPQTPQDEDEWNEPEGDFIDPIAVMQSAQVDEMVHLEDLPPEVQMYA